MLSRIAFKPRGKVLNISGFTAQLVRASHGYREVTGSNSLEVLNFFQASTGI